MPWQSAPELAFAAASTAAAVHTGQRPRSHRLRLNAPLTRVLGVYIAGCVGGVQLLDVLVSRLGWSERVFILAIITAIIGVPVIAGLTVIWQIARDERRPLAGEAAAESRARMSRQSTRAAHGPRTVRSSPDQGAAAAGRTDSPAAGPHEATRLGVTHAAAVDPDSGISASARLEPEPVALVGRIELALSHRRIATAHVQEGDAPGATSHLNAFLAEASRARDQLTRMIDEARAHADDAGAAESAPPGRPGTPGAERAD